MRFILNYAVAVVCFLMYNGIMTTTGQTKINQLLSSLPAGVVLQASWLSEQGYNSDLQKAYRRSHWLESIGTGAMIRNGDTVSYEGAIYALQQQSNMPVHPGGRTALSLLGKAHYLSLSEKKVTVFGEDNARLPTWFLNHDWGVGVDYYQSSFLPSGIGMSEVEIKTYSIKVSGAARALMECLYLAPEKMALMECYELMEGLNNLKPAQVQQLLEKCQSVKVKRLFLYLAEKANHNWTKFLNHEKINVGSGKRSIVKNGVYIDRYQITVPKELAEHGERSV
ncbi:type IV toxin-antitoxin system AbiEi family antitoxin [Mucilaginibacter flavidus]|uniref:type IV toxin-antitoxin system AbiEi family antitoxin n=1 Tax=Mucilaginibacter flavidus TaxID=2949309 RepID=UPI0020936D51|nr:type IV toxin-antitoxin system AbiEi family antitoxin [Mucilaginibacter flavidus]MCO5946717.1 type IV toxin-antitoxin system AbiEi family antitoxin [Mucilaginibacter flavidus]